MISLFCGCTQSDSKKTRSFTKETELTVIYITDYLQMATTNMSSTIGRALRFFMSADTMYKVHSPILYSMASALLSEEKSYYDFDAIESYRLLLLNDKTTISRTDYGAGATNKNFQVSISSIAKKSLSSPEECQSLYRLLLYLQPHTIVEMGTCLGISTAYICKAAPKAQVISLEGDPTLIQKAEELKKKLSLDNLQLHLGEFGQTLSPALAALQTVNFAFLDGNHTYSDTLHYFDLLLPYVSDHAVMIIDDVHWSKGMEEAWAKLRKHPRVMASLDMWQYGVLVFNKDIISTVHHQLLPTRYKAWQVLYGI